MKKIESLGESASGTTFSADEYAARTRELKALNKSIADLQKKSAGKHALVLLISPKLNVA